MKIMRYYWSVERQKHICDMVLYVTRETKTMLMAKDRRNPRMDEVRFRKPKQYGNGIRISTVGKHEKFSQFHYEMELE